MIEEAVELLNIGLIRTIFIPAWLPRDHLSRLYSRRERTLTARVYQRIDVMPRLLAVHAPRFVLLSATDILAWIPLCIERRRVRSY